MAKIGTLEVDIRVNLVGVTKQLEKLKSATDGAINHLKQHKTITEGVGKASQKSAQNVKAYIKAFDRQSRAIQKNLPTGYKVANSYRLMGDGAVKGSRRIMAANESTLKSMLNLRSFMHKIIHYITFSLGVQLVMGLRQGFGQLIESTKEFEKAATNAATISGYLGASFERVRDHIMDVSTALGEETVFSANQVAEAFYDLASAGYDVSQMAKNDLAPILDYAAATGVELAQATQAVMVTLKQFNLEMSDTKRITDVFTSSITSSFMTMEKMSEAMKYAGPIAGTLGISLEETVAGVTALRDIGLEGAQAGQRLNMILTKLLKPTEEAEEMLSGLGLTIADVNPQTNSLADILMTLKAAGFGAAEGAEMFRARTAGAAASIVSNAEKVAMLTQQFESVEGLTKSVAEAQEDTLWGALTKVGNSFVNMSNQLGNALMPALRTVADLANKTLIPTLTAVGKVIFGLVGNVDNLKMLLQILVPAIAAYVTVTKAAVIWGKIHKAVIWGLDLATKAYTAAQILATDALLAWKIVASKTATSTIPTLSTALGTLAALIIAHPIGALAVAVGAVSAAMVFLAFRTGDVRSEFDKLLNKSLTPLEKYFQEHKETVGSVENLYNQMAQLQGRMKLGEQDPYVIQYWEEFAEALGVTVEEAKELTYTSFRFLTPEQQKAAEEVYDSISQNIRGLTSYIKVQMDVNEANEDGVSKMSRYIDAVKERAKSVIKLKAAEQAVTETNKSYKQIIKEVYFAEKERAENNIASFGSYEEMEDHVQTLSTVTRELLDDESWLVDEEGNLLERREVLARVTTDASDSNRELSKSLSSILQSIRNSSPIMDTLIGSLEKYTTLQKERVAIEEEVKNAIEKVSSAQEDYNESVLEYGFASEQATQADNTLMSAIEDKIDYQNELEDVDEDLLKIENLLNQALAGEEITLSDVKDETIELSDKEQELLSITKAIYQNKIEQNKALAKEAYWKSKLTVLDNIRDKGIKYLTSDLKHFYELQDKLYDIELKLYKLREEEDDQAADLFDRLAEQGLISEESIEAYKELRQAQGEVMGLNNQYSKVISKLTPQQLELVDAFMSGEAAQHELAAAGIEGIDTIVKMREAQENLQSTTSNLSGIMSPQIESLMNAGIISSDTAAAYYDLIDNVYETAAAEEELNEQTSDIHESFSEIVGSILQLGKSMISNSSNADEFHEIWGDLLQELGVSGGTLEELNALFQTNKYSLADFTEEELALGAAILKTGGDIGNYQEGMSAVNWLTENNVISTTNLSNSFSELMTKITDLNKEIPTYAQALQEISTWSSIAKTESDELYDSMYDLAELIQNGDWSVEGGVNIEPILQPEADTPAPTPVPTPPPSPYFPLPSDADDWVDLVSSIRTTDAPTPPEEEPINLIGVAGSMADTILRGMNPLYNIVRSTTDVIKNLFGFQEGTIVDKPTPAIIGENGAEAVIPLEGINRQRGISLLNGIIARYFPNEFSPSITSTGAANNMRWTGGNINAGETSDLEELALDPDNIKANKKNINKLTGMLKDEVKVYDETYNKLIPMAAELFKEDIEEGSEGFEYAVDWVIQNQKEASREFSSTVDSASERVSRQIETGANSLYDSLINGGNQFYNTTQSSIGSMSSQFYSIASSFNNIIKQAGNIFSDSIYRVRNYMLDAASYFFNSVAGNGGAGNHFYNQVAGNNGAGYVFSYQISQGALSAYSIISNAGQNFANWVIYGMVRSSVRRSAEGLMALQRGAAITRGPQLSLIGEAGAEAVIPLEGRNRKYGESLLSEIIPKYYPNLLQLQRGALIGGNLGTGSSITNNSEEFNIMGPIYVENVGNAEEFMTDLKLRARSTTKVS